MDGRTNAISDDCWRLSGPNAYDFLRFALAASVIVTHSWSFTSAGGPFDGEPLWLLTNHQRTFGHVAVDGFFLISGLLITQSALRARSVKEFLVKRARRIWPGFIAAALCCWVLMVLLAPNRAVLAAHLDPAALLQQLVLLKTIELPREGFVGVSPYLAMNGSTWTIRYEAACYLMVAALAVVGVLRRRPWVVAVLAIAAWLLYAAHGANAHPDNSPAQWWLDLVPVPWLGEWPRFLACYLAGAAFCLWRHRIPRRRPLALAALAAALVLCAAGRGLGLAFPLLGGYLLFYAASSDRWPALQRWSRYTGGDISYGLYLASWPVQMLLLHVAAPALGVTLGPVALTLLTLPLAMVPAWLSWRFVESPWLGRGRDQNKATLPQEPLPVPPGAGAAPSIS